MQEKKKAEDSEERLIDDDDVGYEDYDDDKAGFELLEEEFSEVLLFVFGKFMDKYSDKEFFQLVIDDLEACCSVLLEELNLRFSGMKIEMLWVTFLDPRSRQMRRIYSPSDINKQCFIEEVTNLL